MTQVELKQHLWDAAQKLKRASLFAENLLSGPVNQGTVITLWQLTTEANAAVNKLRSATSGNDDPKRG